MTRQNFVATQQEFATALLDAAIAVPDGLTAHSGVRVEKRFAVYRNNVVVGLVAALRTRFPAVSRIVGEEFFSAMARVFAVTHPPSSPVMMVYGDGFADFIATFAPA
ncbi:MAG: putative DNA-binding domain-containing protein, partial [Proteobacteria bacterium]|nr:putative DNA-binding domain-containing protein [Pseudomonadota bacterium]